MDIDKLIKIGFNKNEAIIYKSLLKYGESDAYQIIKDTKFHKNIVYDNLDKLIYKGIVTYIFKDNKKYFQIANPKVLMEEFEKEEEKLREKKSLVSDIVDEINSSVNERKLYYKATLYQGIYGIKSYFNDTLCGSDMLILGGPAESLDIMGETFWDNYNMKKNFYEINSKIIFNSSLVEYSKKIKNENVEIRFFEREFEPLTQIQIQDNTVAIIVWLREPLLFLINNKTVADSYRGYFRKMWKNATKL